MQRSWHFTGAGLFAAASLLMTPGAALSQATPNPVLTGLWRFNADKSDHPGEGGASAHGGYERGRGMGGPGGGRGYPRGGRGESAPDPGFLAGLLRPVLQVLIQQTDSTVAISDATGQLTMFHPDGRKIREPQLTGDDLEITAKWKDGKLTIERKYPSIGTLKEAWSLDPLTHDLILEFKMSSSRLPRGIEVRRVYERPAGEP